MTNISCPQISLTQTFLDSLGLPVVVIGQDGGDLLFVTQAAWDVLPQWETGRPSTLHQMCAMIADGDTPPSLPIAPLCMAPSAHLRISKDFGLRTIGPALLDGHKVTVLLVSACDKGTNFRHEQRNFLSMISHEFRTPLGIISASASMMTMVELSDAQQRTELDKIVGAVARMQDLIDASIVNEASDLELGEAGFHPVNLDALVTNLVEDNPNRSHMVQLHLDQGPSYTTHGSTTLLQIAIRNIIDNAQKYSPACFPIQVALTRDGDSIVMSVVDQGIGISHEEQPRIFEKFFRGTQTLRKQGTGLGLYLVRSIITMHGGSVGVNSTPGVGSTFTIRLRAAP